MRAGSPVAIEYVCEKCGSTNVTSDTVVRWNLEKQRWIVVGHYDPSECLDCECERGSAEREISKVAAPA